MDQTNAKILKQLPKLHKNILKNIFNKVMSSRIMPKEFWMCKIIAINKPAESQIHTDQSQFSPH